MHSKVAKMQSVSYIYIIFIRHLKHSILVIFQTTMPGHINLYILQMVKVGYLFSHFDDDVRIATTEIADGEIDTALDPNTKET